MKWYTVSVYSQREKKLTFCLFWEHQSQFIIFTVKHQRLQNKIRFSHFLFPRKTEHEFLISRCDDALSACKICYKFHFKLCSAVYTVVVAVARAGCHIAQFLAQKVEWKIHFSSFFSFTCTPKNVLFLFGVCKISEKTQKKLFVKYEKCEKNPSTLLILGKQQKT